MADFISSYPSTAFDGKMADIDLLKNTSYAEYGSNANGNYIKFSNGTLIQWYKGEAVVGSTNGFTKGFPILFTDNLYVCTPTSLTAKIEIYPDNFAAGYSNFWCYDITDVSTVGKTIKYGYTAIGRWK